MKIKSLFKNILSILLGLLLTGLVLTFSLQLSAFHPTITFYAIGKSDYMDTLRNEIKENAQETINAYGLGQVLDIEESLASFDFETEVLHFVNLRLSGIATEIDTKAFRTYNHRMFEPILNEREGLSAVEKENLLNAVDGQLVVAYSKPFLYTAFAGFLNNGIQYRKLLSIISYALMLGSVVIAIILLFIKKEKWWQPYYVALWVTAIACVLIGVFTWVFRYFSESVSFAVFINALMRIAGIIILNIGLLLAYILTWPILFKVAKKISSKLRKSKEVDE